MKQDINFYYHVKAFLNLQARATAKLGDSKPTSSFVKTATTTLRHTISESEKASYVAHINSFLGNDPFLKEFLPIDASTNALFDLAKDGVLLWYSISNNLTMCVTMIFLSPFLVSSFISPFGAVS